MAPAEPEKKPQPEMKPTITPTASAALPNGELVHIGGASLDRPGLDLLGVVVGSEGTLAVVTKATLRLLRRPEAVVREPAVVESYLGVEAV